MSYDVIYICQGGDSDGWRNNRGLNPADSQAFDAEAGKLHEAGNFVVLSAGRNLACDELFLFQQFEDAMSFYDKGYKAYESVIDGSRCGFQEITLYQSGRKIESKSDDPEETFESEVR
jgi:hypothetical protein